jgi:hypothetical protein
MTAYRRTDRPHARADEGIRAGHAPADHALSMRGRLVERLTGVCEGCADDCRRCLVLSCVRPGVPDGPMAGDGG